MILYKHNNAIESEVFHHSYPDFDRLASYGFLESQHSDARIFYFSKIIMQGDFRVEVEIAQKNQTTNIKSNSHITLHSRVIDVLTEDDYINISIPSIKGEFISSLRKAYQSVLEDIAEHCFIHTRFTNPQTNRLAEYLLTEFNDQPDEPFSKHKDTCVFRNPVNEKWYALVTQVTKRTLEPDHPDYKNDNLAGKQKIEIINIKTDSHLVADMHSIDGIYPAYHMNKKHWISITLDDRLTDTRLFEQVRRSREFTEKKSKPKKLTGTRTEAKHWVIPANPNYYDVIKVFNEKDVIYWYQGASFIVGDIVYMYLGKPYSAILYKCEVIEIDIPSEKLNKKGKPIKRMNLKRLKTYNQKQFPLSYLKDLGLTSIRGARSVPDAVVQAIT